MTHFFGRALAGLVAIVILAGGILALSLYLSGQPLFGMLAGTGLPDQVRQLFRSKESANQQSAQAERQAVPVRVAHIRREAVPVALSFSGRLLARREVEVRARVTGYVSEVTFKEGEIVEKGEVLYRIDPRTFEARLKELQGALQGAKANLAFLQRETERIANLEEKRYAETSQLDELRSQRDQAAARIEELQGRLRQAQLDLEFASVEAPFAGKIGFSDVDEGDLVVQGQTTLTTLVDFHPIEIEFRPNADQLARMKDARARLGHPLRLTVSPDGRDTTVSGEVTALGPAVQNATNTVRVRGEVPNPDQTLVPGQFARVRVQLGTQPSLMAPTAALITQQNKRALYVISADNTVEIVPVEIGQTVGKRVVVQGDLAEGDRVVAGNLQSVRSGRPVRVIAGQGEENGDRRRGGAKGRMN